MAAELIVFFNKTLASEAQNLIKQTGHVMSKIRFVSAQLNAWFKDGLWLELAKLANKNALYLRNQLSQFNEFKILYPTQGNEVFVKMSNLSYDNVLKLNIIPNLWYKIDNDYLVVRFVTSFETNKSQIDEIIDRLKTCF